MSRHLRAAVLAMVFGAAVGAPALAQDYPSQAITWVVPYAAGGGSDVIARLVSSALAKDLNADIIIDNRPGAGTAIGAQAVAQAAPNGYTVGTADSGTLAFNPYLYTKLTYDPAQDFSFVGGLARVPLVLVTRPGFEFTSVQDLIDKARAQPGEISYASAGAGSPHHIAMEMFEQQTGVEMNHIAYKGAAPAVLDLLGDRVDLMMVDIPVGLAHIREGKIKPVGVTMPQRLQSLPDVPTLAELGIDDFVAFAWQGVVAPKGLDEARLQKLDEALQRSLADPSVQSRFADLGILAMPMSSAEFQQLSASESERWGKIIQDANIRLD